LRNQLPLRKLISGVRFVGILKINARVGSNNFPDMNRNRHHDSIVARLKLCSFEPEIDVIFVKCLVVQMEITVVCNGSFGRHVTSHFYPRKVFKSDASPFQVKWTYFRVARDQEDEDIGVNGALAFS
jgi:hypothetical protein